MLERWEHRKRKGCGSARIDVLTMTCADLTVRDQSFAREIRATVSSAPLCLSRSRCSIPSLLSEIAWRRPVSLSSAGMLRNQTKRVSRGQARKSRLRTRLTKHPCIKRANHAKVITPACIVAYPSRQIGELSFRPEGSSYTSSSLMETPDHSARRTSTTLFG